MICKTLESQREVNSMIFFSVGIHSSLIRMCPAHVKRLLQGIGELIDLMKSSPTHTLEHHAMLQTAPSQEVADTLPLTAAEPSDKVDFSRMRGLLEMNMGISHVGESEEDETVSSSHPQSIPAVSLPPAEYQQSAEIPSDVPPQVPRKRGSHQMKGCLIL